MPNKPIGHLTAHRTFIFLKEAALNSSLDTFVTIYMSVLLSEKFDLCKDAFLKLRDKYVEVPPPDQFYPKWLYESFRKKYINA